MISNWERLYTSKIRSNIPREWEHVGIRIISPILFFFFFDFFFLLTFVSQNRRGEITKKEKSLSITDLYFLIWSNPYPLSRLSYRCETGGSTRGCRKESFSFCPFFYKSQLSIQSNIDWIPKHSKILVSPSYINQFPVFSKTINWISYQALQSESRSRH
jgi:hypothetical protein